MFKNNQQTTNNILIYTMLTLLIVSVFLTANNYFSQIRIFQNKELEKLDRVSKSISSMVSGDDIEYLNNKYPTYDDAQNVINDSIYKYYSEMFKMAKDMNEINSEIYSMVYDSLSNDFIFGISSSKDPIWMDHYQEYPPELLNNYFSGGVIDKPYKDENGSWLSAFQPIKNKNNKVVGILQVDEKFDLFLQRARSQVYKNIWLSLLFIIILGALMYVNIRNTLKKQKRLDVEREEIDVLRKELIANISHDLRTPLASIHGYLETIQMKKDTLPKEKMDRYLETSLRNTERLNKLVNELFEISILESKETKIKTEATNINELILDVINNFKLSAQKKGILLETDLIRESVFVECDIQMIERVLQNLISNSIKYCNQDDKIVIRSFKVNLDFLGIQVIDYGEGISDTDLKGIFNRYSMGTTGKTGTGLGLAIVKNILDLHESKYSIDSKLNEGTTFTFGLRIHQK